MGGRPSQQRRGVTLPAGLLAVATPAAVSAEGRGASPAALALAESVMRGLASGTTRLVAVLVAVGALLRRGRDRRRAALR